MITAKLLHIHVPISKLLENLDRFLKLKINGEIYFDSTFMDNPSSNHIELLNSSFDKYGLSKTIHGPFMDLNPGSFDNKVRQLTLERFLETLELCVSLRAKSMVLHSHFEPIFYRRHLREWLKNSEEVWEKLCLKAEKKGVAIYIENSIDESPRAIVALLRAHPYLGACFDVAHYNVFSPEGWKEALEKYPLGVIKEVHLSDNKGDEDTHLALGEGDIKFDELFEAIEDRNGTPIVTIEPHAAEELERSLKFIRRYLKEP